MVDAFAVTAREFLRLTLGGATRLGRLAAQIWGIIAQRVQPLTTTIATTTANAAAAVAAAPAPGAPAAPSTRRPA
ncbi:hypothetical protein B0T13DRAFT_458501 [Neurospora crassa]|nr:hypothetical protein B0T13DRAFT_458501 [Neurospora crassa]